MKRLERMETLDQLIEKLEKNSVKRLYNGAETYFCAADFRKSMVGDIISLASTLNSQIIFVYTDRDEVMLFDKEKVYGFQLSKMEADKRTELMRFYEEASNLQQKPV